MAVCEHRRVSERDERVIHRPGPHPAHVYPQCGNSGRTECNSRPMGLEDSASHERPPAVSGQRVMRRAAQVVATLSRCSCHNQATVPEPSFGNGSSCRSWSCIASGHVTATASSEYPRRTASASVRKRGRPRRRRLLGSRDGPLPSSSLPATASGASGRSMVEVPPPVGSRYRPVRQQVRLEGGC